MTKPGVNSICRCAVSAVEDSPHCRVDAREHESSGGRHKKPLECQNTNVGVKACRFNVMHVVSYTVGEGPGGSL